MARVLFPNTSPTWYEQLKAVHWYSESELERVILDHVKLLFPGFYVIPYKKEVIHSVTRVKKKPDMAFVRSDLSLWGIVEVEMSEHDVAHVLDQTGCFYNGEYNALDVATYMRGKIIEYYAKTISLTRIKDLVSTERPKILVIADEDVSSWRDELKKANTDLCIFEMFKSAKGHYIYRTYGEYPLIRVKEAQCRRDWSLPNTWEIIGDFEFEDFDEISVSFNGSQSRWAPIEYSGKQYLKQLGKGSPLNATSTYRIFKDRTGKLYFEAN